jgi:hypothetical protein
MSNNVPEKQSGIFSSNPVEYYLSLNPGKHPGVKLIILAFFGYQRIMVAALDDASLFQNHNSRGILYRGQPMCDYENGTSLH